MVPDSPCGEPIAWTCVKGNKMKTQSIYAKSMLQAQGSAEQSRRASMSLGKRLAIAIVSLAILSVGMWVGIEQALRATSGAK
jgi:urease accessory protein UreF